VTFTEFIDTHDLEVEIRRVTSRDEWIASLVRVEVMIEGGLLSSDCGRGEDPLDALENLQSKLTGKRLVKNTMTGERHEFNAPKRWDPEP
jgi:hypothetical protein